MKFRFTFYCLLLFSVVGSAQSFSKFSIGGSVHGLFTGAINTSNSSQIVAGSQTYEQYADSVQSYESMRFSVGATLWAHAFINKRWAFQGGLGYIDMGFQRTQHHIQYLDPLFPGIGQGKVLEKSGGSGEKVATYNYRYQYLQVPLFMQYEVYNSKDFFYKVSVCGGIGLNFLLNHQITAKLDNFVVEGESVFHLDSTGYEGKAVTFSAMLGAKGEYRMDKKTIVYIMPVLGICPVSVTKTPIQSYPYYFQLNVGVQYAFSLEDERRK